jgi:hypothetical protein
VGGVLRHIGGELAYAGHNSSVAFGTWSFDVDIQEPLGFDEIIFPFISEQWNYDWPSMQSVGEAYVLVIYFQPTLKMNLVKTSHENGNLFMGEYEDPDLEGWNNFIITRDLTGQFYVYLNGDYIMKGQNLQHTSSERFYFMSTGGPAIDNVTVSDTIDYDAVAPEWDPPIYNQHVMSGESFYYDVNATDSSGIDKWWIDDTENFIIDDEGVITNITDIFEGQYPITVGVNDTLGYTRTQPFTLIVHPIPTTTTTTPTTSITPIGTPPDIPMNLILAVGAGVLVLFILVLWRTGR